MHGAQRRVVGSATRHLEHCAKQLVPKGWPGHATLEWAVTCLLPQGRQSLPISCTFFLSTAFLQLPIIFYVFCTGSPGHGLLSNRLDRHTRFPTSFLGSAGVLAAHHLHLLDLERPLPHELVNLRSAQPLMPILDELELFDSIQALWRPL